jgi:hypothetical protein
VSELTELAVIVPTRSRPQNVAPILEAWTRTGAWGAADLWWILDADDMCLVDYQRELQATPGRVTMHIVPSWLPLVPKLNGSAAGLRGEFGYRYLAFMGDDHLPRTEMWAQKLIANHAGMPRRLRDTPEPTFVQGAGIVYGRDGLQDERLPTWWSMDGRIIDRLGRMVPAMVQHLYCDNAVKALGEKADILGYDPTILIEHMHPVAGKATMDAQYERVNRLQQYERDRVAFESWVVSGLDQDATLLSGI